MAVAFRSLDTKGDGLGTSVVHNAPAGLANNDIMVIFLYKENTAAVTWPAGFSQVGTVTSGTETVYVAWKRASSESGTYTASWTGSKYRWSILAAYSGAITTGNPNDATPTTVATASETNQITCPSITSNYKFASYSVRCNQQSTGLFCTCVIRIHRPRKSNYSNSGCNKGNNWGDWDINIYFYK
jgi:hypothetical protein